MFRAMFEHGIFPFEIFEEGSNIEWTPPSHERAELAGGDNIGALVIETSLDRLFLPSTVRKEISEPPSAPTSPSRIRSIPHPPAVAPAAGGWGIAGSRRVRSVGSSRLLAGGAGELVAWPEWRLRAAVFSSAVGAPVETSGGSAVLRVRASCRRRAVRFPRAGDRETVAPVALLLDGAVLVDRAGVARGARWRFSGTRGSSTSRPPGGFTQSKLEVVEWRGGIRRRRVLQCEEDAGIQKGFSVIFCLFWVFL